MRDRGSALIRNATEGLVLREVRDLLSRTGDAACRCLACEHDVIALSLSSLPPHYCTAFDTEEALAREGSMWVRETVSRSAERVALHPKHGRPGGSSPDHRFRLVNFSFEECESLLEPVLMREEGLCACPRCRDDALAYALNRYPPKYGVERDGEIDLPWKEREIARLEMTTMLRAAADVVSKNPRHGDSPAKAPPPRP